MGTLSLRFVRLGDDRRRKYAGVLVERTSSQPYRAPERGTTVRNHPSFRGLLWAEWAAGRFLFALACCVIAHVPVTIAVSRYVWSCGLPVPSIESGSYFAWYRLTNDALGSPRQPKPSLPVSEGARLGLVAKQDERLRVERTAHSWSRP